MRSLIDSEEGIFSDELKHLHRSEQRRRIWRIYVSTMLAAVLALTIYSIVR